MLDDFKNDLQTLPIDVVTSKWVLDRVPFLFKDNHESYLKWKHILSEKILIDVACIVFTGSSCSGISMNPNKNFKLFDQESDIDLAIISQTHFNEAWVYMKSLGSKQISLSPDESEMIKQHKKSFIYDGTIATDRILNRLPFGKKWFLSFGSMSKQAPTFNRVIKCRIYRDFESLRDYHTKNLKNLRDQLLTPSSDE
jgi:hypothetical protein